MVDYLFAQRNSLIAAVGLCTAHRQRQHGDNSCQYDDISAHLRLFTRLQR
jgi:hypothetical protein